MSILLTYAEMLPTYSLLRPRVARAQKINSLHPLLCFASKKGTCLLLPILLRGSFQKHRGLSAITTPGSAENGDEELIAHGKKRIGLS
jgi:hypothetical protein